MTKLVETDILVIGAGPTGIFTVFEAGLLKLRCHLIDSLPQAGGQLAEIYPKKPIFDIPGYPKILAGDLVNNLMEQAAPFKPGFTLGERAESIEKLSNGHFRLVTNKGTIHEAPVIAIAGGLGCFEPRKPKLENLEYFEDRGVDYIIRNPEKFENKKVVIAGGGDSALDWTIQLAEIAKELTLVHRRQIFRGALDSVEKCMKLADQGKLNLILNSEVSHLNGEEKLEAIELTSKEGEKSTIDTDFFVPLFGLSPKLGPMAKWNLNLNKESIEVNPFDYSTNVEGIYAIGDINNYPGKLRLILCGFHEATLMVQSAFKKIHPDKNLILKYTTVTGIHEFGE